MNGKAHQLRRIAAVLVLVVSVSTLAAQAAAAFDGRSPDTKQAAVTHRTGGGLVVDVRSPDTRAAAQPTSDMSSTVGQSISVAGLSSPAIDMRSPDTRDAIASASAGGSTRTITVSQERFDWADFGMGAAVTAGSLLLFAGLAAAAMSGRRRNHPSTV